MYFNNNGIHYNLEVMEHISGAGINLSYVKGVFKT